MENYLFTTELDKQPTHIEFLSLRNLYLPFIGHQAVTFYNYLIDHNFIANGSVGMTKIEEASIYTGLTMHEIDQSLKRLEAVGLLRTFQSADSKKIIFSIIQPLTPEKVRRNPVLYKAITAKIGKVQFERIFFITKNRELSKSEFKETTSKYHDIFTFMSENVEQKSDDTLDMPMTDIKNIDQAIQALTSAQFIKYITARDASPSQIHLAQRLVSTGLTSEGINHIIKYSYDLNGKVVGNHIEKIGLDFISKGMFNPTEIAIELANAMENKNRASENPFYSEKREEKIVQETPEEHAHNDKWMDLFNSLGGEL